VGTLHSYHIQELVDLPGMLDPAKQDSHVSLPAMRESANPQTQPKHLKMRFRPVGSGDLPPETISTSSEGSEDDHTFGFPEGWEEENSRRKQFINEQDDKHPEIDGSPRKKSKRKGSIMAAESFPLSLPTEQSTGKNQAPTEGSHKRKGHGKHRDETKEERRARREVRREAKGATEKR
jgi:hypothetical protein